MIIKVNGNESKVFAEFDYQLLNKYFI